MEGPHEVGWIGPADTEPLEEKSNEQIEAIERPKTLEERGEARKQKIDAFFARGSGVIDMIKGAPGRLRDFAGRLGMKALGAGDLVAEKISDGLDKAPGTINGTIDTAVNAGTALAERALNATEAVSKSAKDGLELAQRTVDSSWKDTKAKVSGVRAFHDAGVLFLMDKLAGGAQAMARVGEPNSLEAVEAARQREMESVNGKFDRMRNELKRFQSARDDIELIRRRKLSSGRAAFGSAVPTA